MFESVEKMQLLLFAVPFDKKMHFKGHALALLLCPLVLHIPAKIPY